MQVRRVGVVGCGLMGGGIAQVTATAGLETIVREVDEATLQRGLQAIEERLDRAVARQRLEKGERDAIRARLRGTTELEQLAACDLVIEAVTEQKQVKLELFRALDAVCPPETLLASNTSSLSITEMAVATRRPHRFLGLHFFNPVPVMQLVEVVRTLLTEPEAVEAGCAFARTLGKTPVVARERPGFLVNRLLLPYLLDAIRVYDEGLASIEDIDEAMRLGCGYPMGPFTLLDFVGLDTTYYIANVFFEEFREPRYAPPTLLKQMVLAGRLGRKSGRGFYDYGG